MKPKRGRPSKGTEKRSEIMCLAWTKEERELLKAEAIKCATNAQTLLRTIFHDYLKKSN